MFLATAYPMSREGGQVHAYCLMLNHFHLVAEAPQPNLVAGMKWLLGTYTSRFNRRHRELGDLFSGPYKSPIVDGGGNGYLKNGPGIAGSRAGARRGCPQRGVEGAAVD